MPGPQREAPCLICGQGFKLGVRKIRLIEYGLDPYTQTVLGRVHGECYDQVMQAMEIVRNKSVRNGRRGK